MSKACSLQRWQLATVLFFALSIVSMIALVYASEIRRWDIKWGGWPQARYLFLTIIPIATLFVQGWSELVPQRYRMVWVVALVGLLILLDTFSITCLIIPYFYG